MVNQRICELLGLPVLDPFDVQYEGTFIDLNTLKSKNMVIGDYVKCSECNHQYRVRFNIGNSFPQKSTFKCKSCGSYLEYGYDKDQKKILLGLLATEESTVATVQSLHPELPIDPDREADPYYFPSIDYMMKNHGKNLNTLIEFKRGQVSMMRFKSLLDELALPLRYLKEKRFALLEKTYGKDQKKVEKNILKSAMELGRQFTEGKWQPLYRSALVEAEKAKRLPGFAQLKLYLNGRKEELLIEKLCDVLQAYLEAYHELLPTLLSQKFDIKTEGISSSANWKKIEMTYGGLYEVYGDLLVIPTAINNLLVRGSYELFQSSPSFTFNGYLDSDKAGRCVNFLGNPGLEALSHFYDAGIRNATYHKASRVDKEDQEITLKTGKGGKTERKITLLEYISHCNELFARCLILFNVLYKLTF